MGTSPDPEARVRELLERTFQVDRGLSAASLSMHQVPAWDSLGHMNLVAALEAEFAVRFPTYAIPELVSLGAILRILSELEVA